MRIVGVMSGTSYDGIEVAVGDFRLVGGVLELTPRGELSVAYEPELRRRIAEILPPGRVTAEQVCALDTMLGQAFGAAAARLGPADLVVCHGQTVFHWVDGGRALGTLQLGAAAWVAGSAGAPVLSDLRTADIVAGGQGAPLVPVFDALLLAPDAATAAAERRQPARAALNLGGIANVTVIAPGRPVVGYDIGPANALIDAATRRYFDEPCDADGRHAAAGRVDHNLLAVLLAEPYYAAPPPKSTGKELFNGDYLDAMIAKAGSRPAPDDVIATVTELTARIVAAECAKYHVVEVVAAGGGVRNPTLRRRLEELLPRLTTSDELGIPHQAKEAYAFALLGWLSWHGLPGALPSVTGATRAAVLGSWTPGPTGIPDLPLGRQAAPDRMRIVAPGVQDVREPGPDRLGGHER